MSYQLELADLPDLARGAALLGTGGGGDPYVGRLLVETAMRRTGRTITILDPEEVADDAVVIPTAQMGAPTVVCEKLPSGTEALTALQALERHLGVRADATMPFECGGINSMIPLQVAAVSGLPVVDADGMGRAFPELQMETFAVYGVPGSPMAICGDNDEKTIIDTGVDTGRMEAIARAVAVESGGVAHLAAYAMSGAQVRQTAVPRTLSLALRIGRSLREAREAKRDPLEDLGEVLTANGYGALRVLTRGKVVDVERRTEAGFTRGRARIADLDETRVLELQFQNEHLVARVEGELLCVVPDLICVLAADNAEPITTEALRYGQRVTVIGIATPALMRTPEALAVFGPRQFGLDLDFLPVEDLVPS